jgi:23S rRNA pseudouridine1911/1915/1917 synthase
VENKKTESVSLIAKPEHKGMRLDRAVSTVSEIQTRSRAQKLIELDLVLVNGKLQKSSYAVQEGDAIQIEIPIESNELIPLEMDLEILFEDKDLAVIFKPSGLVVHPAEGHAQDTLVNVLLSKIKNLSMGFNENRPGIVHRLDKETSGLLVIAKNDKTHEALSEQFRARTVQREYYALVYGKLKSKKGRIESKLARDPRNRKRFASTRGEGKVAITNYALHKEYASGVSELRVKLETGRTHQIRVHLSQMGHPILADSLYGSDPLAKKLKSRNLEKLILGLGRIALHAAILGFKHPITGEDLSFHRDWPQDMRAILEQIG